MKAGRAMKAGLATITATIGIGVAGTFQAVEINDIFLFGDSYTETVPSCRSPTDRRRAPTWRARSASTSSRRRAPPLARAA